VDSDLQLVRDTGASTSTVIEGADVPRVRLESIDLLRGVIMILMALDHTRDFFGNSGVNPTDPATTTIPLFFTRWITHFCAPVFFLLTGTGAYLSLRKKSKTELSRFLFTRGLWLIFLEMTVTRCLGWQFNFDYHLLLLMVLWALGWSMVVLSGLVYLPVSVVTAFGIVMIATHNLFDGVQSSNSLWIILHSQNFLMNRPGFQLLAVYPLIPWVGVTAAGYGLGQIYRWVQMRRKAFLLRLGAGLCGAFLVLRAINLYGDPARWSVQKSAAFTVLSFLNTTKYPPSLLYLAMTLGPMLLLAAATDSARGRFANWIATFGGVPFFYYIAHLYLLHILAVLFAWATIGNVAFTASQKPEGFGIGLVGIYAVWLTVVITLYPLCRWFAAIKQRHTEWWWSYL